VLTDVGKFATLAWMDRKIRPVSWIKVLKEMLK